MILPKNFVQILDNMISLTSLYLTFTDDILSKIPVTKPKTLGNIVKPKLTGILSINNWVTGVSCEIDTEIPRFPVNNSERYLKNWVNKG